MTYYYKEESNLLYPIFAKQRQCSTKNDKNFHHLYKNIQELCYYSNQFKSNWRGRDILVCQALLASHYWSRYLTKQIHENMLFQLKKRGKTGLFLLNCKIPLYLYLSVLFIRTRLPNLAICKRVKAGYSGLDQIETYCLIFPPFKVFCNDNSCSEQEAHVCTRF